MPHRPFVNEKLVAHRRVIGRKIRQFRGERNLTLKETADLCGVSVAHISELERGRISPTVNTMLKVATGFEKPISFFLPNEYLTTVQITREGEQKTLDSEGTVERILGERIPGSRLEGIHLTLQRGGIFGPQPDSREETIVIVLKGEIELLLDGELHRLKKGDTLHIKEQTPQLLKNLSRGTSELMWISATLPLGM